MADIVSVHDLEGEPHATVFPESEPKTVRLTLDAGEEVPAHTHSDREIVLYLIEGAIELELDDETYELTAGDVARFDGRREVSPRANEPSVALIVLAQRTDD